MPKLGMGFLIHGFAQHGQHHVEHYLQHFVTYPQRGGGEAAPPFVDTLSNAANNALHDAGYAETCRIAEVCTTYSHLNNLDLPTV